MQFQLKIKPMRVVTVLCTCDRKKVKENDRSKYLPTHRTKILMHKVFWRFFLQRLLFVDALVTFNLRNNIIFFSKSRVDF